MTLGKTCWCATVLLCSTVRAEDWGDYCCDGGPAPSFTIPAGDAEAALKRYACLHRWSIVYEPNSLDGYKTNAIVNERDPQVALTAMLKDTGLTVTNPAHDYMFVSPLPTAIIERKRTRRLLAPRPSAHKPPLVNSGRPREEGDPNCICAAQIDPRHAADWLHWCMVGGNPAMLRWTRDCDIESEGN